MSSSCSCNRNVFCAAGIWNHDHLSLRWTDGVEVAQAGNTLWHAIQVANERFQFARPLDVKKSCNAPGRFRIVNSVGMDASTFFHIIHGTFDPRQKPSLYVSWIPQIHAPMSPCLDYDLQFIGAKPEEMACNKQLAREFEKQQVLIEQQNQEMSETELRYGVRWVYQTLREFHRDVLSGFVQKGDFVKVVSSRGNAFYKTNDNHPQVWEFDTQIGTFQGVTEVVETKNGIEDSIIEDSILVVNFHNESGDLCQVAQKEWAQITLLSRQGSEDFELDEEALVAQNALTQSGQARRMAELEGWTFL